MGYELGRRDGENGTIGNGENKERKYGGLERKGSELFVGMVIE